MTPHTFLEVVYPRGMEVHPEMKLFHRLIKQVDQDQQVVEDRCLIQG